MEFPWPKRRTVEQRAQAVIDSGSWTVNDGFANVKTGVGLSRQDVNVYFCPGFQAPEATLSDLVDTNWLARKIVRGLPEAAMQEKILFPEDAAQARWDAINQVEGNDDGAFLTAQCWARTHGCALLILGQDWGGDPSTPASTDAPVEWLEPVRSEDFSVAYSDLCADMANAKRFGRPDYYTIQGLHRFRGQRVHYSRVVHFAGPAYTDPTHSRSRIKMQGLSALDPVYEVIGQYSLSWSAIAEMIQQGSVPIWTLKGLIAGLSAKGAELGNRLAIQQEQASVMKAILLDADGGEAYRRENVSFADIPEIIKQLTLQVSAAANTPVSELFGRIVAGLGDTGDVEDRKWVRRVETYRTNSLAPRVARIMGPAVKFQWQPITIPTPLERADLEKRYWDMGVTTEKESRTFAEKALNLEPATPEDLAELEARNAARPEVDPALAGF